jgi:DNA-binding NarL/FixJ family response regulator
MAATPHTDSDVRRLPAPIVSRLKSVIWRARWIQLLKGTLATVAVGLFAVLAVMGQHSYRSPSLRSGTLLYLSCPRLTKREYEVLDLLASGLTDREIAERLVVSEETAKTYTNRLLKTLDVNNRLQAVLKGMRCGMVQL